MTRATRTLLFLFVALPAQADRGSALFAVEAWHEVDRPAHGVVMLAHDADAAAGEPRYSAEFNTDTLRLGVDGVPLGGGVTAGARLAGELFISGLLSDYYVDGEIDLGRGFFAHYAQAQAWVKARVAARTYVDAELGVRRWFFDTAADTDPALRLPDPTFVFEPRARVTWWALADDAGFRDRHRWYPHLRGLALGAQAGLDLREKSQPWGARDAAAFASADRRNAPEQVSPSVEAWLDCGWGPSPAFRTQLSERAGWRWGADDLNRARVGGMTPYGVPVAGAPWAHYLTDGYLGLLWSGHARLAEGLEAGPLATATWLRDVHRTGDDALGFVWGVGALLDWRSGPYQVDVRGGWSPSLADASGKPAWSALVAGGLLLE